MASYEELLLLDGIGVMLAQRIIDYREANWMSIIDEMQNITGIEPGTIAKIKPQGLARVCNYY